MWRDEEQRAESARRRLALAKEIWQWAPHTRQEQFFCSPAQVRVAACGRRWGKTEALSIDIATLALDELRQGRACRQIIVAPTDVQARLLGEEVGRRLQAARDQLPEGMAAWEPKTRLRPSLTITLSGSSPGPHVTASIVCRSAGRDGRSLRGLWAHRIIVDEAGLVPDTVLTDVLMPMLADVGGEYVLASSPLGRRSAFYRLFAKGLSAGLSQAAGLASQSFQCPTTDNPHLNQAFLEAQREELGETMYAREYEAQFVDDYGAVFPEADIDAALVADPRVRGTDGHLIGDPVEGRLYSIGIDWGRKQDFTVVAILDGTEKPARLVALRRWLGTGWERQVAEVAHLIARFAPLRVLVDGNSLGDPVAEALQTTLRTVVSAEERCPCVERFTFSADSKANLVDRLAMGLSARALTYPPHKALLTELRSFEYGETRSNGRPKMGARSGGHDDCVMALALAWQCAPDGVPKSPSEQVMLASQAGLAVWQE